MCLADTLIAKGQFADAYKYVKGVLKADNNFFTVSGRTNST